jgi:hypothetical protein
MPASPSLLIVPARFKTGKLYTQIATTSAGLVLGSSGDFNVTRGTTATRFNSAGLIESVASGVPRLDYSTSGGTAGCPALLVEASGSNLFLRSNELNIGAPWTQDNIGFTTGSTSAFTSPDGTTNAFLLADTSGNTRHRISQQPTTSFVSGTTYTASIFVKKNSSSRFLLINGNTAFGAMAVLNLDTLAITNINGTGASIDNYGNGWYRFSVRGTATSTQATSVFIQMQNAAADGTYVGDGSSFYLYGAQLETGSVATSYIPTTAALVTRNADVVSLSGAVSGCIGQTEGTIYAEVDSRNQQTGRIVSFQIAGTAGSGQIRIDTVGAGLRCRLNNASGTDVFSLTSSPNMSLGINKIAFAFNAAASGIVVALNGSIITTATAAASTVHNATQLTIGAQDSVAGFGSFYNDRIRSLAIYATRLTNAELQSLTTL